MLRRRVEDVEGSIPPKDSIVLRCKMSSVQSAIYDWVKSTGTLRLDPEDEERKLQRNPNYPVKQYKTLNNRCMELRKTCNHPLLNYPFFSDLSKKFIVKSCGKLWILDRILIKLQRTGHRVLLFSTMTKLLDILEEYLQWRRLVYRRIDGTTSLEDRESAINDFNGPDSDCFIFLLSIRAAGRGLNLQSADTVVIYDPDPNPKNEEQAVARAHRIGQKRPVKVIYMEAVVDKIPSPQKEDEMRGGGTADSEDELVGKDCYIGSIEGLIRNNIQQYKIDMADEVINAGRFDQRATHEERRLTLETLLHDEERYQETIHDVPSLQEKVLLKNAEDDWLETEKKVITIHRLHQILEPFMLRRHVEDVEGSLPPKDSIVLRCKMSSVQSAIYDWVKSTGTLRLDPEDEERKLQRNPNYPVKQYKTLNNRCMELRKTCNHLLLNYPFFSDLSKKFIVKSCGKLWILDRILIKLQRTGHRVLLFNCFIFLLSIRAAGKGLNLQSADTVVICDPDPNPKNEEQAVSRAHRIGQKRPVKVIYMEAVVDKIPSPQKEDEMRGGGTADSEDELVGKDRYIGSIEGLIRNNIQQYKIDMADEVINVGRFDQRTTHEERRLTLETLLHDEERYQETIHDVPSLQECLS
ncbi:hypothetical protein RYX36_018601 [Vicia faba]